LKTENKCARFLKTENKCARFAELKQKTTIAVYVHLFWGKHKCTTSANPPPGFVLDTFLFLLNLQK
jgi:hypothetical protein